jgi:chain length determinant protein tyrosine kinase EpsG
MNARAIDHAAESLGAGAAASTRAVAPSSERHIGALLVDAGKLDLADAEKVMQLQGESGMRFGEAAVALGLVSSADIQAVLAEQFDFPVLAPGNTAVRKEVIAAYDASAPQVELFRAIRSQLALRWFSPERRTLAVVSARTGDGRSYVTANLGVLFSQLCQRTLLIDADLRNPTLHTLFGAPNRSGLSAWLAGRADRSVIHRVPGLRHLAVLPAGAIPPNPQELLARPALPALLRDLARDHDVVLVDTPAAGANADALTVAARAGGAVLVVRKSRTRVAELRDLAAAIAEANAEAVGTILNDR